MLNQRQTVKDLIAKHNKPNPLADYLLPYIGGKKEVKIADIGSGAWSIIGSYLDEIDLKIYNSDNQDFTDFWKKQNIIPFMIPEYQDMERLTYPDNFFDVVHCVNALDHTKDALAAVKEMIRVCKPGGYVYIKCWLSQLDTGHLHKWNVTKTGAFENGIGAFDLRSLGFQIDYTDLGGESRYNFIDAILRK